jgi:hypothetical protein
VSGKLFLGHNRTSSDATDSNHRARIDLTDLRLKEQIRTEHDLFVSCADGWPLHGEPIAPKGMTLASLLIPEPPPTSVYDIVPVVDDRTTR